MPNDIYYVFDDRKCKAEGMTKEQIINAIHEATGVTPTDVDEGFISTIVETNKSRSLHIWKGTQAEYNALETHDPATYYIIDDDSTIDDIEAEVNQLGSRVSDIEDEIFGTGWTDIKKTNLQSEETLIGKYKRVGKIVFYRFVFTASDFDFPQVTLPVPINPAYGGSVSFLFFNENGDTTTVGKAFTVGTDTLSFKTIGGETLAAINCSFSWPIYE